MILGKDKTPQADTINVLQGTFSNVSNFPKSNLSLESATKSVFIEIAANTTATVNLLDGATQIQANYQGLRPHPLLGFDELLLDGTVELSINGNVKNFGGEGYIVIDGNSESKTNVSFQLENTASEAKIVRIDDYFAFDPVEIGRNFNRGFRVDFRQLSRAVRNEFGVTAVIERNAIREITMSISLLNKAQRTKLKNFFVDLKKKPFIMLGDEDEITVEESEEMAGKFYIDQNIQTRHTFGQYWQTPIKMIEFV